MASELLLDIQIFHEGRLAVRDAEENAVGPEHLAFVDLEFALRRARNSAPSDHPANTYQGDALQGILRVMRRALAAGDRIKRTSSGVRVLKHFAKILPTS